MTICISEIEIGKMLVGATIGLVVIYVAALLDDWWRTKKDESQDESL